MILVNIGTAILELRLLALNLRDHSRVIRTLLGTTAVLANLKVDRYKEMIIGNGSMLSIF